VYLGTILRNAGYEVEILDEHISKIDVSAIKSEIIGIGTYTVTAKRGYDLARHFADRRVIMGSLHPSMLPLEAAEHADHVVIGEAENIILDLVQGKIKDKIIRGKPVENLDNLPFPDFSLVKGLKQPLRMQPISTSRGCPYDCSFCSVVKMFGREYRFRSSQNIIDEIRINNIQGAMFIDDNFTAFPERTKHLLNSMIERDVTLPRGYWCQARVETAQDDELLNLLVKTNCKVVFVGFESMDPNTLKYYNKKQDIVDIENTCRKFHERGIMVMGSFMIGADTDTQDTLSTCMEWWKKLNIDAIALSVLTPFPGTRIYDELDAQGRIFTKDWERYNLGHIVFRPKNMTAFDLQKRYLHAYKKIIHYKYARLWLEFWHGVPKFIGKPLAAILSRYQNLIDTIVSSRYLAYLKAIGEN